MAGGSDIRKNRDLFFASSSEFLEIPGVLP
jgi:hypothetical protein